MVVERLIERCKSDLFTEGATSLQLRLRERFRVAAVDYRRRRSSRISPTDAYFSSTLHRCLDGFSNFRKHSLPSPSTFYRKTVGKDIDTEDDSVLTRMLQGIVVPVLGNVCHVFMHGLNRVQIFGAEKLHEALLHRPENKSLITVSNHVAAMDDPLVIASLLPPSMMLDARNIRWTLCASDRCFKNAVTSAFFKYVKVLPVSRGDGIYQKGMDLAISKLNCGGWVHIFPEGSRSRDGGKTMGSAKRGIGRLVLDADNLPIVIPFVHTGMQEVMPVGAKFPKIGKMVTVVIGDPINFDDLINEEANQNISRGKLYDAVSARIGDRLKKLKLQVEEIARIPERAAGILQEVDWVVPLMENYGATDDVSLRHGITSNGESNSEDWAFKVGFSGGGGLVSMIRGYMGSTELVGFAARGLFTNRKKYFDSPQEVSPLRVCNTFWKSAFGDYRIPPNSVLAAEMPQS